MKFFELNKAFSDTVSTVSDFFGTVLGVGITSNYVGGDISKNHAL